MEKDESKISIDAQFTKAVIKGETQEVKRLLEAGVKVTDYHIVCALAGGFNELAELLRAHREEKNERTNYAEQLIDAAKKADIAKVVELIKHVDDINVKSEALRIVAWHNPWNPNEELLKVLLDAGADPNKKDEFGRTALYWPSTRQLDPTRYWNHASGGFVYREFCYENKLQLDDFYSSDSPGPPTVRFIMAYMKEKEDLKERTHIVKQKKPRNPILELFKWGRQAKNTKPVSPI